MPVLAATRHAAAQNFPSRPIKIIVPFPPGGGVDLTARLLMEPLSEELGQTIIVENKGGAGGIIGVEAMSHAPADGYALALTGVGTLRRTASAQDALRPDGAVAHHTPGAHAVHRGGAQRPASQDAAGVHGARKKTEIRWASGGIGTSQHLAGELYPDVGPEDGARAYRGTGPALNDLAAGIVDAYFGDPATLGLIKERQGRRGDLDDALVGPARRAGARRSGAGLPGRELVCDRGTAQDARAGDGGADGRHPEGDGRSGGEGEVRRGRPASATMPRAEYVAYLQSDSKTWGDVVAKGNIKIDEN